MPTAQELITRSLKLVTVLADGETASASIMSDSLTILNDMLGLWNVDKLLIYQIQTTTHTLVSGTSSYTVGSGADINITRPVRIEQAFVRDSSNYDYQLEVINQEQYNRIRLKDTESIPQQLFYDSGFANGIIRLFPTPSTADTLHFTSWKPFIAFATLTTNIDLPQGYNQLMVYNLAVLLGTEFGAPLRPEVIQVALDTKAKIETVNNQNFSDVTQYDSVFGGNRYRDYDR